MDAPAPAPQPEALPEPPAASRPGLTGMLSGFSQPGLPSAPPRPELPIDKPSHYTDLASLNAELEEGGAKLVRAEFLLSWQSPIPSRDELSAKAASKYTHIDELEPDLPEPEKVEASEAELFLTGPVTDDVIVVAVAHAPAPLTKAQREENKGPSTPPGHPDPLAHHLGVVKAVLGHFVRAAGGGLGKSVVVYWDYMSEHAGTGASAPLWFAHANVLKMLFTASPTSTVRARRPSSGSPPPVM